MDNETSMEKAADPSAEKPSTADDKRATRKKWLIENVISLGSALLFVLVLRSSIVESFKIPSGSMIPTLAIGDYIFVNKFSYGFKIPFSDFFTGHPVFIVDRAGPSRGDIFVFKFPKDESVYFIKRVIGLPGDRIEVRDKMLFINDKAVPRDPLPADQAKSILDSRVTLDPQYTVANPELYMEHLGGVDHVIMLDREGYRTTSFGPVTVPEGQYFAMGDNRDVSNDSRYWGFVPAKNIAGRAMVVWFNFAAELAQMEFYFHPSRIGTVLH